MDIILCHDTEDVYTPAELGFDAVPMRLAEIYSQEGVPANFMVIAQRAEVLRARGRKDVIAAMRRHSIGVHTRWDGQPYDAVVACDNDWDEGLAIIRQMETEAYKIVGEVFDTQPVCLSGHALNAAPQMHVVARELGLPFNYGYAAAPPLYNISRVSGTLNFPFFTRPMPITEPYFEGFDDTLSSEREFEAHLERFDGKIDACMAAKHPAMLVHPCHPFKVYSLDWVDYYVSPNGVIIPPEDYPKRRGPGQRTWGQVELALRNFRRLVQYIRRHPHLNPISIPDAVAKYGKVPDSIGRFDLQAAAQRTVATKQVALDDRFSPAELAIGFAQALVTFGREGNLPAEVARDNDCLGPIEDPLITPEEPCQVGFEVVLGLAEGLLREVKEKRRLPANLPLPGANGPRAVSPGGKLVGLGSVYHLLARAYLGIIEEGRPPEELDVWRFPRQPQLGHSIGQQYADVAESQLVRPNLDIGRLYRYGKLQTWTLAPAWRTEPQMDPDEHGY